MSTQDEPSSKKIADLIIAAAFIAISQKRGTILPLRGVAWNLKERLAASRFKRALSDLQEPSIVSALPSGTKHKKPTRRSSPFGAVVLLQRPLRMQHEHHDFRFSLIVLAVLA
ncbi:MAG: hypothetical protein WAM53_11195 [Terrimicrobiaceae bacterium]